MAFFRGQMQAVQSILKRAEGESVWLMGLHILAGRKPLPSYEGWCVEV
jgi:hypothetical protein